MQTLDLWAYEVEQDDFLVIDGAVVGQVKEKNDEGDGILFTVKDEDGDVTQLPFGPFESAVIVSSFEDDEVDIDF